MHNALLNLSTSTRDGQARAAALAQWSQRDDEPGSVVPYRSAGSLLVIGPAQAAHAAARRAANLEGIHCTLLTTDAAGGEAGLQREDGHQVLRFGIERLQGFLGEFQVIPTVPQEAALLAEATRGRGLFDLVLDLSQRPLIGAAVPPPGYFAAADDAALDAALAAIPELVGEFEKPKYFHYDASLCAHGRSGLTACTRCIDTCPTDAILSHGDSVEVNPGLCQGAGSCATACPSGAITYVVPRLSDRLDGLRAMLQTYREQGGADPVVLFHDGEAGRHLLDGLAGRLPGQVLPVQVEEVGSVGMDTWLSVLAYGASAVMLLGHAAVPASVARELETQLATAHALLAGMGYGAERLRYLRSADTGLLAEFTTVPASVLPAAAFAGMDDKRSVIRFAVDHLFAAAAGRTHPLVSLPTGAPFGEVQLDSTRCTLCMACVSQCPGNALSAGDDTPQLGFIEANCVQCGLCCRTCPEDAIAISPRYVYDFPTRNTRRVLYEEEPFACIRCGKPFATRRVIDTISRKLQAHPMFQGEALQRIQMCEDCRVQDIYGDVDGDAQLPVEPLPPGEMK